MCHTSYFEYTLKHAIQKRMVCHHAILSPGPRAAIVSFRHKTHFSAAALLQLTFNFDRLSHETSLHVDQLGDDFLPALPMFKKIAVLRGLFIGEQPHPKTLKTIKIERSVRIHHKETIRPGKIINLAKNIS